MIQRTTPTQFDCRIVHQPEAHRPSISHRKTLDRPLIKHGRSKTFHPRVARARNHCVTVAVKHWHPNPPLIIQPKPISIGPLHCIETAHLTLPFCCLPTATFSGPFCRAKPLPLCQSLPVDAFAPKRVVSFFCGRVFYKCGHQVLWRRSPETNNTRKTTLGADPDVESRS